MLFGRIRPNQILALLGGTAAAGFLVGALATLHGLSSAAAAAQRAPMAANAHAAASHCYPVDEANVRCEPARAPS